MDTLCPYPTHCRSSLYAGVGRAAGRGVGDVGRHHVLVEVVAEVEDVVLDAELASHAASVLDVGHRAATGVGLAAPQIHGDADDVTPGFEQQCGGDRRVDASPHRDETAPAVRGEPPGPPSRAWARRLAHASRTPVRAARQ